MLRRTSILRELFRVYCKTKKSTFSGIMAAVTGDRPTLVGIRSLILFRCDNKTAVVTTVSSQIYVEGGSSSSPTCLTTTHIVKLLVYAILLLFVKIDRHCCHNCPETHIQSNKSKYTHIIIII